MHESANAVAAIASLPAWIDDGLNEPRVTAATSTSYTLVWPAITGAAKYEIYHVTTWDPITETKFAETTETSITLTSNLQAGLRVKAVDASSAVLDRWVVGINQQTLVPAFLTGTFVDNFDDGVVNPAYYVRNPTQTSESGGVFQLNQNVTDNGPNLAIGYDTQGKRYVHLSLKWYQHRANGYYSGAIGISSFSNSADIVSLTNMHQDYSGQYGTKILYESYDVHNDIPFSRPIQSLGATEYFDTWITWDIILDTQTGVYRVKLNGAEFSSFDTPYVYREKILFYISPYGWNTGHYVQIDDLLIESSNTPY